MLEIETLHLTRHVRRSNHRQWLPIELKIVFVNGNPRTRLQILQIANPEAGPVDGAHLSVCQEVRVDDVQSLFLRRLQQYRRYYWKRCHSLCAVIRLLLRKHSNFHAEFSRRFAEAVPQNLRLHWLARQVERKCGPNCETFRALHCSFRKHPNEVGGLRSS